MQETYARAFRAWRSYTAGHEPARVAAADPHEPEHRPRPPAAALARRWQPLEEGDYYLYNQARGAGARAERSTRSASTSGSRRTIVAALSRGPHDFRDVIVLVDIGDFSYADAAQILEIPIGTVMSQAALRRRILKTPASPDEAVTSA